MNQPNYFGTIAPSASAVCSGQPLCEEKDVESLVSVFEEGVAATGKKFLTCFLFEFEIDISAAFIYIHGCEVDGRPFESTPCLHRFFSLLY